MVASRTRCGSGRARRTKSERTWSVITGAGSDAYTAVVTDAGQVLRAMVSYDDAVGPAERLCLRRRRRWTRRVR